MTDLIAALSTGKGTWTQVVSLIRSEDWETVYLITNAFGKEKFTCDSPVKMIILDENLSIDKMKDQIIGELKDKLKMEVAVNIVSGTGKEHMALLSALISLGVGIRFVVENNGLKEL